MKEKIAKMEVQQSNQDDLTPVKTLEKEEADRLKYEPALGTNWKSLLKEAHKIDPKHERLLIWGNEKEIDEKENHTGACTTNNCMFASDVLKASKPKGSASSSIRRPRPNGLRITP